VSPFLNNSPKHVAAEGLFSQLANRQIFVANHSEELTHNLKAEKLTKSFNSCAALLSFLPPECSLEQVKSLFETKNSKKGEKDFPRWLLLALFYICFATFTAENVKRELPKGEKAQGATVRMSNATCTTKARLCPCLLTVTNAPRLFPGRIKLFTIFSRVQYI